MYELTGKEPFQTCLNVYEGFYILLYLPYYVLSIISTNSIRCKKKAKISYEKKLSKKIFFQLSFGIKKNIILFFTYKFDFKEFKLEIRTGRNFLFILREPRIMDFFGPCNFLLTSILDLCGFGRLNGLEGKIEIGAGFNRSNFFLCKIYPHYIKKEFSVLEGVKFTYNTFIYPLFISFFSSLSGYRIWINRIQKIQNFNFLQICNLKVGKIDKIVTFFSLSNCSQYLAMTNLSVLSTFKISYENDKMFHKIVSLGKIEDSLILSLMDTCWGSGNYNYVIGGFNNGKIVIWNEILIPILQFLNSSFFIVNLKNKKKPFDFVFILKKHTTVTKEYGKKKILKFLPQTIVCDMTVSKFKIKKSLNIEWFLLNIAHLKHSYKLKKKSIFILDTFSTNITFFFKIQ